MKQAAVQVLDVLSLKHPDPIVKLALQSPDMKKNDILEIVGDCPCFERDVRIWCGRLKKSIISVKDEGQKSKRIQIRF